MSSPNLDLVRSIYAAWERGDFRSTEWAHPEIEFVIADGPSPGTWRGLAGMAEAFRSSLNAWEDFRPVADECRELDDGSVLVLLRAGSGRGKTSGLDIGADAHSGSEPIPLQREQGYEARRLSRLPARAHGPLARVLRGLGAGVVVNLLGARPDASQGPYP